MLSFSLRSYLTCWSRDIFSRCKTWIWPLSVLYTRTKSAFVWWIRFTLSSFCCSCCSSFAWSSRCRDLAFSYASRVFFSAIWTCYFRSVLSWVLLISSRPSSTACYLKASIESVCFWRRFVVLSSSYFILFTCYSCSATLLPRYFWISCSILVIWLRCSTARCSRAASSWMIFVVDSSSFVIRVMFSSFKDSDCSWLRWCPCRYFWSCSTVYSLRESSDLTCCSSSSNLFSIDLVAIC